MYILNAKIFKVKAINYGQIKSNIESHPLLCVMFVLTHFYEFLFRLYALKLVDCFLR